MAERKQGRLAFVFIAAAALIVPSAAVGAPSLYVTDNAAGDVSQFVIAANGLLGVNSPASVATGNFPQEIAVSPDGRSAYVTEDAGVAQYDVSVNGTLSAKSPAVVAADNTPEGITVSPDGKSAYAVNGGSDDVSQYDVDLATGKLTPKSPATVSTGVGSGPFRIAL